MPKRNQKTRGERIEAARAMLKRYESDPDAPVDLAGGFALSHLHAALDLVKNRTHWKYAINRKVYMTPDEAACMAAAVPFFTGSVADIECIDPVGGRYHVRADGYFHAVGA